MYFLISHIIISQNPIFTYHIIMSINIFFSNIIIISDSIK